MSARKILRPAVLLFLGAVCTASAAPEKGERAVAVNAAPGFSGGASVGRNITLSSLRGKPVLLLIASSPRNAAFRRQCSELRGYYERLAAQGLICFAAFTAESGRVPSNIPFILANDPAAVAAAYGVFGEFAVAVVGIDGNLDCLSTKPLPGYRVLDLVVNNAEMQRLLRK